MTAREKLTNLTLLWMTYSVVTSAAMFFVRGGFGFWNVALSSVGLLVGLGLNFGIGSALQSRNGLVRWLVVLVAAAGAFLATVALGKVCLLFVATWSLGLFVPFAALATIVAMNVHSLRVLFSRNVRRHFR